jgi:glycosyltransferase involved in cell wall biosynthesis
MVEEEAEVLYLSYDGLTDPLGQSQILPYLIGLSKKGFRITIISFEKPDRFSSGKEAIGQICNEYGLNWQPLKYHKSPPVISTLRDLWKLWRTATSLHSRHKFTIVHCRSYITSIVGLRMRKKYAVKFIFDMRGFWADERVEGGLWNLSNPVYKFIYGYFKRLEGRFLNEADAIISLTHAAKDYLIGINKNVSKKITVIPCSVDLQLFDPSSIDPARQSALRNELQIDQHDFVLTYLGSLGTWYMYREMMDFFDELKKLRQQAKFLILTSDTKLVDERDDVIVRTIKRSEVPLYTSISDAAIFFIKPSFSKKASSATKMGEVMAMGLPIITNQGWGDVDFFACKNDAIVLRDEQAANNILRRFDSQKIRDCAQEHLSLEMAVDSYGKVYQVLLA